MRLMSGNLCHQSEHHLYPDLPSNRLYEISFRVMQICDKYDLPYTTGPFLLQYGKAWRTIAKLSLPDRWLRDGADDAPETRSERMFTDLEPGFAVTDPASGRRRGLKTGDRHRSTAAPCQARQIVPADVGPLYLPPPAEAIGRRCSPGAE